MFLTLWFCSVGVFKNGRVEIIPNDQGNRITPSYVAFTADGERLIGDAAKNQLTTNPENTVFDAKRLLGREFTDTSVQHDMKYFPFKVIKNYRLIVGLVFTFFSFARSSTRIPSHTLRLRHLRAKRSLHRKRSLPWCWER